VIEPGLSPGQLDTGSLDLQPASTLRIEIEGNVPGLLYDQVNTTGSVTLGGDLSLLVPTYVANLADVFTIILNDGADSVQGIFNGLPEGALVGVFFGRSYNITYVGNADGGPLGNDVLITVPEPGSFSALAVAGAVAMGLQRFRRKSVVSAIQRG
jgi:hypothetical protein